jgi:hypothetical protein
MLFYSKKKFEDQIKYLKKKLFFESTIIIIIYEKSKL